MPVAIHQVLATLGYGDAIGHEVLGIQRVLRAAGYESEIFVETADYRLEPQTRDYRELIDFSRADNLLLHHFSLGSRASRTAFAVPDRMALWHSRCPENPEFGGAIPPILAAARTLHWFDPCNLLTSDARSELRPEFRERQTGGGWTAKGCRLH